MGYVGKPFEHDIFVSYSHGATSKNGAPSETERLLQGWSLKFARELEQELRVDLDYRNTLSFSIDAHERPDERFDPNLGLSGEVERHVGPSAILLVLMSPDYQISRWCSRERKTWWEKQGSLGFPPHGRIAVVRIKPLNEGPQSQWPPELTDSLGNPLVGYPFYSGEGRAARPLGWTEWASGFSPQVREKLLGIVGDLYYRLDLIQAEAKRRRAAEDDANRLAQSTKQTLYVHGRADQIEAWKRTTSALIESGYTILPGQPDPIVTNPKALEKIRKQRVQLLTQCDALVLVGSNDGRAIDEDLVVVGKHDRHSARARAHRLLPCALLDTSGHLIATEVRRNTARAVHADWLDATVNPTGDVVRHWLSQAGKMAMGATP